MTPPENPSLANAVTAYATTLSGIVPLALCWLMSPHTRDFSVWDKQAG